MGGTLDGLARWLRGRPVGLRACSALIALYIRLVNATTRWRVEGREHHDRLLAEGGGIILVAWHGRVLMSPLWGDPGRRTVAMISANRDGELVARVVARFGICTVRGSSHDHAKGRDKGGLRAYVGARRELLREGAILGISPDGPRGPRMRAQPGAARLSIETGCPVQPVTFSTRRGRVLRSWDRFLLPFPFDRGVQIWGEPLRPPASGDAQAAGRYLAEIERALTAITHRSDRLCGRAPVEPGAVPSVAPARDAARAATP
jgi:lysophospholipid acyltransferase (LPLAT)-like uncharacterized protein